MLYRFDNQSVKNLCLTPSRKSQNCIKGATIIGGNLSFGDRLIMKFTIWILVLFCGFILAENAVNETAICVKTLSCFPDMSTFLQEFGAMKEELKAIKTRLKESENHVLELKQKGRTSLLTALEVSLRILKGFNHFIFI